MNRKFLVITIPILLILGIITFLILNSQRDRDSNKTPFSEEPIQPPLNREVLIRELSDTGVMVKLLDEKSSPFFFSIGATTLVINNGELLFFEFDNKGQAESEALQVGSDGSSIRGQKMEWDITPHFFKKDRFVVLYRGGDREILRALEAVFGLEFAGGYEPIMPKELPFVSWEGAINLLRTAKVIRIHQTHSGNIYLDLKDGTVLKTKEPSLDAIFEEIRKCGETCKGIDIGQE